MVVLPRMSWAWFSLFPYSKGFWVVWLEFLFWYVVIWMVRLVFFLNCKVFWVVWFVFLLNRIVFGMIGLVFFLDCEVLWMIRLEFFLNRKVLLFRS